MFTRRGIFISIFLVPAFVVLAQKPSAISLFMSDSVRHVQLETDLKNLVKHKHKEEYQPAVLRVLNDTGDTSVLDIKIRSRGNIRKEVCYYPPIKLKLPKSEYSFQKLKWVNTCRGSESFAQFLLKEYLAYQIFEQLTDRSFRTYLLQVEYIDTGRDGDRFTQYAFVIENEDELAERMGGRVHEPKVLKEEYLNRDQLALFTLFEYLIANTDYAFKNRHNLEIVTHPSTNTLLSIPYDFDYSGFVHTPYATPHETVPIDAVDERYNNAYCLTKEECEAARMVFLDKKDEIYALCSSLPGLTDRTRKRTLSFIESFFDLVENERLSERIFVRNCREMEE